jgi:hypothetical protein
VGLRVTEEQDVDIMAKTDEMDIYIQNAGYLILEVK